MKAYRMTYESKERGTIEIVTMGRDMIDAQAQAAGWAHATSLAFNEEIELVAIAKLACEQVELDPVVGKVAEKAVTRQRKVSAKPEPRKSALFACQECGRKFRSVRAAERAVEQGCPNCGGSDIDLAGAGR